MAKDVRDMVSGGQGGKTPEGQLTPRENAMAILNREQPDYYGDIMDTIELIGDPLFLADNYFGPDGEQHADTWGTVKQWMPGAPGAHPVITDENKVIKDIECWEDQVRFPDVAGYDWSNAVAQAEAVDRREKFVGAFMPTGIFERTHFLMGMEDAFCAYLEEPEAMHALQRAICNWKLDYIDEWCKHIQPDIVFYHDDWGTKRNTFLPPDTWREFIKPLQAEISEQFHERGIIYMHHSDCYCEPLAPDMVEIGVQIWQGAIPQNDIVAIQEATKGKLAMVGGIDGPAIDIEGISEDAIRAEVRRAFDTYCPGGRFYPAIANGVCFIERNNEIFMDEKAKYGRIYAQEHPVEELRTYED